MLWREMDRQCSKNMVAAIPRWLPAYEEENEQFVPDIRERLLSISHSTVDRLLKPYRFRGKRKCGTRTSPLRDEIPIASKVFHDDMPGHIEVDTVAHCGGDMSGSFVWSFTATDIVTG